jgi:hypothetical protein
LASQDIDDEERRGISARHVGTHCSSTPLRRGPVFVDELAVARLRPGSQKVPNALRTRNWREPRGRRIARRDRF